MSDASAEKKAEAVVASRKQAQAATQEISAEEQARRRTAIEAILALRDSGKITPVTREEILAWRHEGHRY